MLQAASEGIAPTAQDLPRSQDGEYFTKRVSEVFLFKTCHADVQVKIKGLLQFDTNPVVLCI